MARKNKSTSAKRKTGANGTPAPRITPLRSAENPDGGEPRVTPLTELEVVHLEKLLTQQELLQERRKVIALEAAALAQREEVLNKEILENNAARNSFLVSKGVDPAHSTDLNSEQQALVTVVPA